MPLFAAASYGMDLAADLLLGDVGPHDARLAVVGVGLTLVVYGAVALIVRADDMGCISGPEYGASVEPSRLTQPDGDGSPRPAGPRATATHHGRETSPVRGMPPFLALLALVGTTAMLWVGGGILLHTLEVYSWGGPAHVVHVAAEWVGFFSSVRWRRV